MGQLTNRQTDVPREVDVYYVRTLLESGQPTLLYDMFAQMGIVIPSKSGTNTAKFRRYGNLAAAGVLDEGITPAGSKASVQSITATPLQYGDYLTTTDIVDLETPDPVFTEFNKLLGRQAGVTFNGVARDVLQGGTQVTRQGGHTARSSITATDLPDATTLQNIVDNLKNRYAMKITERINATTGVGTQAVDPSFVGLCSVATGRHLKGLDGFQRAKDYASTSTLLHSREIGAFDEIRFIEGDETMVFDGEGASDIDVHGTLIFGMGAYGTVGLGSNTISSHIKGFGSGDDPLFQRASTGWKGHKTYVRLNEDNMQRYEHAV